MPEGIPSVLLIDQPSAIYPWLAKCKWFDANKIELKIPSTSPLIHPSHTLPQTLKASELYRNRLMRLSLPHWLNDYLVQNWGGDGSWGQRGMYEELFTCTLSMFLALVIYIWFTGKILKIQLKVRYYWIWKSIYNFFLMPSFLNSKHSLKLQNYQICIFIKTFLNIEILQYCRIWIKRHYIFVKLCQCFNPASSSA